jgi:putative AbiEi antitoxin of type IV toxin-antitoxin system
MSPQASTVEEKLARIAGNQHGVVTRAQLLAAGISDDEIKWRRQKGLLIRVHRGTYRVGHRARSVEARYLAAVLACGPGAVLSGKAAGHLLGLLNGAPPPPEVTTRAQRRVQGVRTRRAKHVHATTFKGIPVTTVPQTLVDLAATLSEGRLAGACHEAGVKYGTTPAKVEPLLAAFPNRPGVAKLRRIMRGEARITLSTLERGFLAFLRREGLPLPRTNRVASAKRVDCRWPEQGLTVELDSYQYHNSRHAWEQDRRREREAFARGDDFRRYTWGDVFEHPHRMRAELRALLS